MSDDTTPLQPGSTRLSRSVLQRAGRLARSGSALARTVAARHDVRRTAEPPRLVPAASASVARTVAPDDAPGAEPIDDEARRGEAERLSRLSGYAPDVMEYLVGNARPAGPAPLALGDAAAGIQRVARREAGERPATPRRSAIEEDAAPRALRLSRTPAQPVVEPRVSAAQPPGEALSPQATGAAPGPVPAQDPVPAHDDGEPPAAFADELAAASAAHPATSRARLTLARRVAPDEPATASTTAPPVALRLARRAAPEQPDVPVAPRLARRAAPEPPDVPVPREPAAGPPAPEPPAGREAGPLGRLWRRVASGPRGSEPGPEPARPRRGAAAAARVAPVLARTPTGEAPAPAATTADDAHTLAATTAGDPHTLAATTAGDPHTLAATTAGDSHAPALATATTGDPQTPALALARTRDATALALAAGATGVARAPGGPAPGVAQAPPAPGATRAGAATARLARTPARQTERPRLRVQRREAPAAGAASAPEPARPLTTAQVLARATAGAIEYEDEGRVSVLLPPPGAVFGSPPRAIAREESIAEPAGAAPIAPSAPAESLPPAERARDGGRSRRRP